VCPFRQNHGQLFGLRTKQIALTGLSENMATRKEPALPLAVRNANKHNRALFTLGYKERVRLAVLRLTCSLELPSSNLGLSNWYAYA